MNNQRLIIFAGMILLIAVSITSDKGNAQQTSSDCDYCAPLAIPDVETLKSDKELFADYLSLIDWSNYSQAKTLIGVDAVIPVEGFPIEFGGSYERFNEQRSLFYEHIRFKRTQKEAIETLKQKLHPEIARQYNECIKLCTQREGFIRWQFDGSTDKTLSIRLKLLPYPRGAQVETIRDFFITGGLIPRQMFGNGYRLRTGNVVIPAVRTTGEFRLTFNAGPHAVSVYLPAPVPSPKYQWLEETMGVDCTGKDRKYGRKGLSQPNPSECNADTLGTIAICWESDRQHPLGPMCTYKYVRPQDCFGGGSPGQMYTCKRR